MTAPVQHHPGPPPGWRPVRPTNGLAVTALVTGPCGFAIIPIVLGHLALRQIAARGESGDGMAVVGLVLGYLALCGYVLLGALAVGGLWLGLGGRW